MIFALCVKRKFILISPLPYRNNSQMKKRPTSAVGYKRPISQYARVAMAMGSHPRYRVRSWEIEMGDMGENPRRGDADHLYSLKVPITLAILKID